MASKFFNYASGIPKSRILPFDREKVVSTQLQRPLRQIGINSTTEFYEFIESNHKHLEMIGLISGLGEDELSRLREQTTQRLEKFGMIDVRCGPESDPCSSLPKSIVRQK